MPQKNSTTDTSGVRIVEICGNDAIDCQEAVHRIQVMIEEQQDKSKVNFSKNPYGTGYAMYQRTLGNKATTTLDPSQTTYTSVIDPA
jgi:hypothetical protein